MIFYSKQSLENHFLLKQTTEALEDGLISEAVSEELKKQHPEQLFMPNFFMRIGLFILTNMAALFSLGTIVALIFSSFSADNYHYLGYFMGISTLTVFEIMLRGKAYYRSGVDDGLSWMVVSFFAMGFSNLFDHHPIWYCFLLLILLILSCIRYLNEVLAGASVVTFLALIYFIAAHVGGAAMDFLPFIFLTLSSLIVLVVEKFRYNAAYRHLDYPIRAVQATALVLVYLSINYFVVREGSIQLMHKSIQPEEQIPLGSFFWLLTFMIPFAFMVVGLRKKQPVKYRIGILTFAISIFTVRYYYHLISLEIVLTIAGVLMIVLGYILIQYFREIRHGYSYHTKGRKQEEGVAQAEAWMIGEGMGGQAPETDRGFGGGSSGGGGATGSF